VVTLLKPWNLLFSSGKKKKKRRRRRRKISCTTTLLATRSIRGCQKSSRTVPHSCK